MMNNTTVKKMYRVSFVSGLVLELLLSQTDLANLIRHKKVCGYQKIVLDNQSSTCYNKYINEREVKGNERNLFNER